ncbi:hypothetical protein ACX9NE_03135 [Mycobacterium sp. ML4]
MISSSHRSGDGGNGGPGTPPGAPGTGGNAGLVLGQDGNTTSA